MEANWTDPLLFFIYSVAKPVAAALILVVMLEIIAGAHEPEYRSFVVVGSALWSFVTAGIAGLAWSVLDDRERYRMLKYVYVSPSDFLIVLLGRGVARVAVGAMGAAITLAHRRRPAGRAVRPVRRRLALLVVVMVLGVASIVAIGVHPGRRSACRPARRRGRTRRRWPAPCSSCRARCSRSRSCRRRSRQSGWSTR